MQRNRPSYRHRHEETTAEFIETLAPKAPPLRLDADGILRVGGTRVTLDSVIGAYEAGATAEAIATQYDSLSLRDVYGAITIISKTRTKWPPICANSRRRRQKCVASSRRALRKPALGSACWRGDGRTSSAIAAVALRSADAS
jgi:hypothetical protein